MNENKVRGNNKKNSKLSKNTKKKVVTGKLSIRDRIRIEEQKSIIKNKFRIFFRVVTVILILFVILIYTNSDKNIDIDENSDIYKLNASEYSAQIVNLYNREGQLEAFVTEMDRVQSLIGLYVISNSTLKENSFSDLIKTLNKEINNERWSTLDSEKSKYYNGSYSIDDIGNLKFKFANKKIEPNWINNEKIARYIVLN